MCFRGSFRRICPADEAGQHRFSLRRRYAINTYDELKDAISQAGFHTNGVMDHGSWHRTCVCSKRDSTGLLTGNSFWVSRMPSGWYLGTWGGYIYRLPDENSLAELCVKWLSRVPNGTRYDFDPWLKDEFRLVAVTESDFEIEAGDSQSTRA